MIYDKESYERDHIGEDKEETFNTDIEVLKLQKLSSPKSIDYLEKEYDERNQMNMSDDNESNDRDNISKHYEEKVTEDIEV